jgi:DNA-binding XRE family transcriptional regulator
MPKRFFVCPKCGSTLAARAYKAVCCNHPNFEKVESEYCGTYDEGGLERMRQRRREILADAFCAFIERRGWTQEEAAAVLGVTQSRISEWTRGVRPIPPYIAAHIQTLDSKENDHAEA